MSSLEPDRTLPPRRRGAGRAAPRGAQGVPGDEIERTLRRACAEGAPAVVLVRESSDTFRGRFAAVDRARVVIALDPADAPSALRPLSLCCVSFAQGDQAFVFLAPLWRILGDASSRRLLLATPGQMSAMDARTALRVPAVVAGELAVRMQTYDRRSWTPTAVDVSRTGILLDFGSERGPRLPVGALVELRLELDALSVALTAVVRRQDGARLGLSFVDSGHGRELAPPPGLDALVERLESHWLSCVAAL